MYLNTLIAFLLTALGSIDHKQKHDVNMLCAYLSLLNDKKIESQGCSPPDFNEAKRSLVSDVSGAKIMPFIQH